MATPLGSLVLDTLKEECSLVPPAPECSPMGGYSVKEPLMFLPPPMPSTLGRMSTVQNTFIHRSPLAEADARHSEPHHPRQILEEIAQLNARRFVYKDRTPGCSEVFIAVG
eukprot:CAMPEP_0183388682 /NCGR_PEP_ID=MMETSP0370-20130417/4296_1 /TAXON_ID=268820 /ORGANISM="Peridinium aciculiferum, Strain PAER-2" /LENGTH=110 /DNA_ID=CAMNT_0025567693 /DNA_START=8 /DNA_END=340 /DNA_ORIENTATION=-